LIIGHEIGHFLTARLFGIKVEEFGLGFPPRLKTLFEAGGTKFSLNWIPFGGFVRIAGENDPDVKNGLADSPKGIRAIVLIAGPAVNVLLAIVAFVFAFRFAAPDPNRVLIIGVADNSPAEQVGMQSGDLILKVDDIEVDGVDKLTTAVGERVGDQIGVTLDRDGEIITVSLTPRTHFPQGQGPMGISLGYATKEVQWGEAIRTGVEATIFQFREIISLPVKLLEREIDPEDARVLGPVGIAHVFSDVAAIDRSAQRPFWTLTLTGAISIGLAIGNLLPIPALDGGRLIFILIEFLIGKRISPRFEGLAHTIGFAVLLVILIFVTVTDIVNPPAFP
jgi:regulator of sigma E protease